MFCETSFRSVVDLVWLACFVWMDSVDSARLNRSLNAVTQILLSFLRVRPCYRISCIQNRIGYAAQGETERRHPYSLSLNASALGVQNG